MKWKFAVLAAIMIAVPAIQRSVAAELSFKHSAIDTSVKDPWAKIIADIDRDGFADVVIGGRSGPLVWYRYPDWKKTVIVKGGYKTVDGEAGDVDGDGDLDIVMGGLFWYENPLPASDPAKSPWTTHKVADHRTHDIELADLDKDGDLDIVSRDQSDFGAKAGNKVYLWCQGKGDKWTHKVLECPHGEGIAVSDIDCDGDHDVVIGGIWFENDGKITDGAWRAHKFGDWHSSASVEVADINGDGRPDVVLSPSELRGNWYHLSWFEAPADPRKPAWKEHVIVKRIECVIHGLATADFNGDGAVDIATSEMHQGEDPDEVAVFINRGRGAGWDKQILSKRGSHCIQMGDIGGDGDMDIMGANWSGPYQPVEVWENESGGWVHLSTMAGDLPSADVGRQAASLILDIDRDGVNDFVIAGWSDETSMVWFRRTADGWKRYLIDNRKSHIEAGGTYWDIDGDGDLDILQGGSWATNEVWWWENPYPSYDPAKPWNRHTIKDFGAKQHHDQIFGDFDGDGKAELVFWNQREQKLFIADIPKTPKNKKSWSFTEIWSWPKAFKYEGFAKADVNLDGKIDLIGGGMWFEHEGQKRFKTHVVDKNYGMSRSAAGDFIEGGRPEIVLNSGDGVGPLNLYSWQGAKWVKRTLIEKIDHGHTLQVGDINGDGHLDIYAAEMYDPGSKEKCRQYVLYGDGKGGFDIEVVSTGIGTHEGRIGDLDGDGDLDILQKDFQHDQRVDIWLNDGTSQASGAWLREGYLYRVPLRVRTGDVERENAVVEVPLDFGRLLRRSGRSAPQKAASVCVLEIDDAGKSLHEMVPVQFDTDVDDDSTPALRGTLTFVLWGRTPANAEKLFHVYFDFGPHLAMTHISEPSVSAAEGIEHEGQESFKITTPGAVYYYHKQGAGFASIEDRDGNDWLSYNPGVGRASNSGSGGKYRGTPNMGHPEGYCHPGSDKSTSRLLSPGPVKATIVSESDDGNWACRWDVFPHYARLTALKVSHPYWFLYEGTPGGKLDEDSDYCVRSDGTRTAASDRWTGDISAEGETAEWLYFGDGKMDRVLYLVHHTDDDEIDSYWPMNHEMTVFGFGRNGLNKYMTQVPDQFTVGFCESAKFPVVSKAVQSACRPLVVMVGSPQVRG